MKKKPSPKRNACHCCQSPVGTNPDCPLCTRLNARLRPPVVFSAVGRRILRVHE